MSEGSVVQFAQRMSLLPPYLFGAINKLRMEKRAKGEDIIDLGMGNPTDPTPAAVTEKLCEVVKDRRNHRYPVAPGLRNLRAEIAKVYQRDYSVTLDPDDEVICTIGSKEGISHLSLALIGPGDTVLVPTPAFPIHIYAAIIAGGNVIGIPLETDTEFLAKNRVDVPLALPEAENVGFEFSSQSHRSGYHAGDIRSRCPAGSEIPVHGDS